MEGNQPKNLDAYMHDSRMQTVGWRGPGRGAGVGWRGLMGRKRGHCNTFNKINKIKAIQGLLIGLMSILLGLREVHSPQ